MGKCILDKKYSCEIQELLSLDEGKAYYQQELAEATWTMIQLETVEPIRGQTVFSQPIRSEDRPDRSEAGCATSTVTKQIVFQTKYLDVDFRFGWETVNSEGQLTITCRREWIILVVNWIVIFPRRKSIKKILVKI